MSIVPMFNSRRPPEVEDAHLRQETIDSLHRALTGAVDGIEQIPTFLKECFAREVWKHPRVHANGGPQSPTTFHEFVHRRYPVGLGTGYDTLRGFIREDIELLAMFDRASQNPDGAPLGNKNAAADKTTVNNVHSCLEEATAGRPSGNAAQAALRRLEKAVADGVIGAWALQQEVLQGLKSPHAAMVEMGWRPRTVTVRDDADALTNAAMSKAGPVETAMRAWRKMTETEQRIFTQWIDEQVVR